MEGFEGLMGKHGVKWLVQNRRSALKLEAQLQSPYDDPVTDKRGRLRGYTETNIIQSMQHGIGHKADWFLIS